MKEFTNNKDNNTDCVYIYGCSVLIAITKWNGAIQEEVCNKGGLKVFLKGLESNDLCCRMLCWEAVEEVLSSKKTYSEFCTTEVLNAFKKWCEKCKEDEVIDKHLLTLTREVDTVVKDAVTKSVCTKKAILESRCKCSCKEGVYCPRCCARQNVFRCHTCDKEEVKLYCETCRKRDHQTHECEEFFYSVRCATK